MTYICEFQVTGYKLGGRVFINDPMVEARGALKYYILIYVS